ncbi:Uncharacterised protein [Streptococcus gordonii]|nr:Uncharacterised protein [Streptococcus gordonii]
MEPSTSNTWTYCHLLKQATRSKPTTCFVLEDPKHQELNGEGIKVLIQAQKTFTYNGESIDEFKKGGRLELGTATAWPFVGKG